MTYPTYNPEAAEIEGPSAENCWECGKIVYEGWEECPNCGAPTEDDSPNDNTLKAYEGGWPERVNEYCHICGTRSPDPDNCPECQDRRDAAEGDERNEARWDRW